MDRIRNPEMPEADDPRRFIEGEPDGAPSTPLGVDYLNGLQEELINLIVASGQEPDEGDLQQLLKAIKKISQEVQQGVQVDEITASGTWLKPKGAKWHTFIVVGQGAGGQSGSGAYQYSSGITSGGMGGGGGACCVISMAPHQVAESCAVIVGTEGGRGGSASVHEDPWQQVHGEAGQSSLIILSPSSVLCALGAFPPGLGGTQGGFGGGFSFTMGGSLHMGGRGGWRNGDALGGPHTTGGAMNGSPGGGGGGGAGSFYQFDSHEENVGKYHPPRRGHNTAFSISNFHGDGYGGLHSDVISLAPEGGAAGYVGGGGMGGGTNPDGSGQRGGNGMLYGGGGGGGGAGLWPHRGGDGGDGAPGVVVIVTFF